MGVIPVQPLVAAISAVVLLIAGFLGGSFSSDNSTLSSLSAEDNQQTAPLETAPFSDSGYSLVTDPSQVKAILAKGLKAPSKFPLTVSAVFDGEGEHGIGSLNEEIDVNLSHAEITKITGDGTVEVGVTNSTDVSPRDLHNATLAEVLLGGGPMVIAVNKSGDKYLIGGNRNGRGIVMVAQN